MAQLRKREVDRLHVLYFRPPSAAPTALDEKLAEIAGRHRDRLRLVTKPCNRSGLFCGAWVSGCSPTVLMVAGGRAVRQFIGDPSAYEIEGLVLSALAGTRADR